jgi:flagellar basal-body rod protein FlgG
MTQGIHPLTANMVNQLNRVDTVSNNLANVNTIGFKEDNIVEGSFNEYLNRATEKKEDIKPLSYVMNTIPKIDGNYIDNRVGAISPTGNKLDFAINAQDKYFKVKDKNGNIFLTRNGEFKNINNTLVTADGFKVLDKDNNPINLQENKNFAKSLAIVSAEFKDLKKVGDNNYQIVNKNNIKDELNTDNYVLQGSIERSTVNPIKSMVALIEAQRDFERAWFDLGLPRDIE